MRPALACLLVAIASADAAAQMVKDLPGKAKASCAQCGVITSIEPRTREQRSMTSESAPSGLVASVPLGNASKAQVGPSQRLGREAVLTETDYHVVVKLGDGSYRFIRLDNRGEWQEGDDVRVEGARLLHP